MNRVIFLDFDGVIITPRACTALDPIKRGEICAKIANRADPVAVAAIAAVCATGVRIVVSSSWRKMEEQCRHILRENGLEQFLHPDWRTRDDRYVGPGGKLDRRGDQIADWLAAHPEVRSYRILDDSDEMLPLQSPYFVLCHAYDGLGYYHIKKLLEWAVGEEEAA
jgi:hypothetical protein